MSQGRIAGILRPALPVPRFTQKRLGTGDDNGGDESGEEQSEEDEDYDFDDEDDDEEEEVDDSCPPGYDIGLFEKVTCPPQLMRSARARFLSWLNSFNL